MDAYEEALSTRRTLLTTPCDVCGVARGWCVDAGGRRIRNVYRQHVARYRLARIPKATLRVLDAIADQTSTSRSPTTRSA